MDLEKDFPLGLRPRSWHLNEVYLSMLRDEWARWQGMAFRPTFGAEISFALATPGEMEEWLKDKCPTTDGDRINKKPASGPLLHFARERAGDHSPDKQRLADKIANIFMRFEDPILKAEDENWFKLDASSMREALEDLLAVMLETDSVKTTEFLKTVPGYKDEDAPALAAHNLFLAIQHFFLPEEGGLRGLIEPRFGNRNLSIGWWDSDARDAEVHLIPVSDPFEFMRNYYTVHHIAFRNACAYNLFLATDSFFTQPHIALYDTATGRNVMRLASVEDADILEACYRGFIDVVAAVPFIFHDTTTKNMTLVDYDLGESRVSSIRQRKETLEFRNVKADVNIIHLPKNLWALLAGFRHGLDSDAEKQMFVTVDRITMPVVQHVFGEKSAFLSTLSHTEIQDDGCLRPSLDVIAFNHALLLAELGDYFHDVVKRSGGKGYPKQDLRNPHVWLKIFGQIRIGDDNQIILPDDMHPEIAAIFERLKVTGRRIMLKAERPIEPETLLLNVREKIETLQDNPTIGRLLRSEFITPLTDGLRVYLDSALAQLSEQTLGSFLEAVHDLDLDDESAKRRLYRKIFAELTRFQIDEMRCLLCDENEDAHNTANGNSQIIENPESETKNPAAEESQPVSRDNIIPGNKYSYPVLLRPHFIKTLQGAVASGDPRFSSNHFTAAAQELVEYLEKDAPKLSSYIDDMIETMELLFSIFEKEACVSKTNALISSVALMAQIHMAFDLMLIDRKITLSELKHDVDLFRTLFEDNMMEKIRDAKSSGNKLKARFMRQSLKNARTTIQVLVETSNKIGEDFTPA